MSKIKKLIIGLLIAVVVIGATVAIIVVFKNKNQEKKTVNVFSVEQMMMTSDMDFYLIRLPAFVINILK